MPSALVLTAILVAVLASLRLAALEDDAFRITTVLRHVRILLDRLAPSIYSESSR
ncbi:MAG TPA: hypothetical protein VHU89_09955 [Acidobacteriaceae bacterium]|jgi:hypothetical protein|nr:hypothetical protein [Acidobacteriaceae bacterium]